ncbi:alpha/beta hydrolase [uncultured Thiodictyon sp.]|uniref:alpha/beta hydrolase n=1 Tax=uncultured Thiodictyon sp. TaxID=1846217 RepID=UPI0025CFDC8B|nr:alpha/beta hydrolase [uncultured Thiodictyon sp.]
MIKTLAELLLFLGLLAGGLYLLQPWMVFMPSREIAQTPGDWGLAYEELWLRARDGVRLHAWYLPQPGAHQVLLFFHGNAGNISHRRSSLEIFHRRGLAVLILDYRGYGRSDGRPSEAGLYRDATAAWDYLVGTRGIAPGAIVIFGRSLGGAVAARLAAEVQPAGLILESTFSSVPDLAGALYPVLSHITMLRYRFDTVSALSAVRCPVLVLHSREDDIIPYALGQRVYEAAHPPKAFQDLIGDHNGGFLLSPGYEQGLAQFLAHTNGTAFPSYLSAEPATVFP